MELRFSSFAFCILFLGFIVFEVVACKDTTDSTTSVVFPASGPVSYSLVDELFQQRCSISGCHNSTTDAAGLNLLSPSYHALITYSPPLVVAGNAKNSLLYQVLAGKINPPMPPPGVTQLNSNQINGIALWINNGANNP